MKLASIFLLLSASFWETKAPSEWSEEELIRMFTDSPWAQMVQPPGSADAHGEAVQVYLASAGPMQQAEKEKQRRYVRKQHQEEDPLTIEARLWAEDNQATQIVLAVRAMHNKEFDDARETRRMEEESIMHVGRKKFKMTGHFPPTNNDPYLRMAFPRQVTETDKSITFDLYIPGARPPFRSVEFKVKDLILKGKLEL
jgi:hypothetical protein